MSLRSRVARLESQRPAGPSEAADPINLLWREYYAQVMDSLAGEPEVAAGIRRSVEANEPWFFKPGQRVKPMEGGLDGRLWWMTATVEHNLDLGWRAVKEKRGEPPGEPPFVLSPLGQIRKAEAVAAVVREMVREGTGSVPAVVEQFERARAEGRPTAELVALARALLDSLNEALRAGGLEPF